MADNKTQVVITAKDDTAAGFASVKTGLDKLSGAFATLGGLAVGGGLIASVKSIIDLGDSMHDLSQKVGINIKDLATWQLAADQSGTSIESVAKGVKGLSQFMVANGNAMAKAGIDAKDANGALIQLADLFKAMPDGIEKTALAVKLFGKAGMDMIPMLNQGSAGLAEAQEKARLYGERMALLAPQADKFNDQLAELALQSKAASINLALLVAGPMTDWLEANNAALRIAGSAAEAARLFVFNLDAMTSETPREEIDRLTKSLKDFQEASTLGKFIESPTGAIFGGREEDLKKQIEFLKFLERQAALAGAAKLGDYRDANDRRFANAGQMSAAEAQKKARDLLGKEGDDKESAFLSGLRNQLHAAQGDISEYSKVLEAVSAGAAKDFSQATKSAALELAKKIDILKAATKANELHAQVLEKVAKAEEGAARALDDFSFRQEQNLAGIASRIEGMGKTPQEIKQIEAARAIEKEYEDSVKKINEELGKIGDIEGISEKVHNLSLRRDQAHKDTAAALDAEKSKQDALNASWEYGADTALRKYSDEIANVAATVEGAMTRAFKGMEDALVGFVKTGKLDFKSLADSIISDMIRMQVQQSIMKPLTTAMQESGGLGGILSSLFGGGRASGGAVHPGQYYVVGEHGPEVLVPNASGTVIPSGAGAMGGQSVIIHQTVNIDSRSDQGVIMAAMVQAKNAAIAEIHNSMRRGGAFA